MDFFKVSAQEWSAIWLSVKVASLCSLVTLPLAIAAGWWLARKSFRGKVLVNGLIHLPLVIPPVTIGFLLLMLFGVDGWLGKWLYGLFGIRVAFTFAAAVMAAMVVSFPLVVRSIRVAFEMIDPHYEEASRTLGAGPWATFFRVSLPLAYPGILSGFILAFARSLGEFGATIVFAGNIQGVTQTLPLAIYSFMEIPGEELAALRLVLFSVIISLAAMAGSEWLNLRISRK
jgi:molybdate transport system permease protein